MERLNLRVLIALCVIVSVMAGANPSWAAETVSYVYDAKGRLVQVVRAGSVNNGATTTYVLDKAGNRVSVTTTKP
jgi:hypothetical protein